MSYSYQEQIDRFATELADEAFQKRKNPDYKESFTAENIAGSISRIYEVEYEKALKDLNYKKNLYFTKLVN